MHYAAIVTSAGSSVRFSGNTQDSSESAQQKKEFVRPSCLGGRTVLESACKAFIETEGLEYLVITYRKNTLEATRDAVGNILKSFDRILFVEGGNTRQESVHLALESLGRLEDITFDLVAIHDGSRPFLTSDLVCRCLEGASRTGGCAPVLNETDTVVEVVDGLFAGRLDRSRIFRIQTPQVFRFPDILQAHRAAAEKSRQGCLYTDDTQVFMDYGCAVESVEGDPGNRKITYAEDLA